MSGGTISLERSIRSCQVNTGEANRIQTDRFFNPNNMVCIPWNGLNNKGQTVCPDSFYTKTAGCDSAEDRVMVENSLRPKYFNYVTLGAAGVQADIYGNGGQVADQVNSLDRAKFLNSRNSITGNYGSQFGANVQYQGCTVGKAPCNTGSQGSDGYQGCSITAYERNMAQVNQQLRSENYMNNGMLASTYQRSGGNR
jgi:hypothetical protein